MGLRPEGNNLGMPWVLEAVGNLGINPEEDKSPAAQVKPSWLTAYALCPYTNMAEPLLAILGMDARMRDSVKITASKAVTPWNPVGSHGERRSHGAERGGDAEHRIPRYHDARRT